MGWQRDLLAVVSVSQEQREADRQEALRLAASACSPARWWARIRNEAIIKAWGAGATRREIADASGIALATVNEAVRNHPQYSDDDETKPLRDRSVNAVELSGCVTPTLLENGIRTVGDLLDCPRERLLSFAGMGRKKVDSIARDLARMVAVEEHGGEDGYARWVAANAERFVVYRGWNWDERRYFETKEEAIGSINFDEGSYNIGAEFGTHYAHVATFGKRAAG